MKRLTALPLCLAVVASLMSGCGGDDTYCDNLASAEENFQRLEASDFSNFDEFAEQVEGLAKDGPDEVKDDWKVISDAFTEFTDALDEVGLEPKDLGKELPPGVDPDAFAAAMATARNLSSVEFRTASDNIDTHAKDECNFEFEGT